MPWYFEVKYWRDGRRVVEIFTEKQGKAADTRAKQVNVGVSTTCTTHDYEKEFREIRKRQFNKPTKGGAA